ncbi:MAG: sulfite exporter TauE/SafE family protein [Acidobacteriota bacterium]
MSAYLWLIPIGFVVGAFGTIIGVGGGFLLVPVLLLFYPEQSTETITSISLAVVFFNALSGSLAYARMGRINYRFGVWFSLATVPGAILGVLTTPFFPRRAFEAIFGFFMVLLAAFLLLRFNNEQNTQEYKAANRASNSNKEPRNLGRGIVFSLFIGYISSVLGIGGGILHVPTMVTLLNFPVHIATATSQFTLAIMAFTGTVGHIALGTFQQSIRETVALAVGALLGAPIGARFSNRLEAGWIMRSLAITLGFVGIRIFLKAL